MTDDELKRAVEALSPEKRAEVEAEIEDVHASMAVAKAELDRTVRALLDVDRMSFVAICGALGDVLTVCLTSNLMAMTSLAGPKGEEIARTYAANLLLAIEMSVKGIEPQMMAKAPKGVM